MTGNRITILIVVAAICALLAFLVYQFGSTKQVNWYTLFREKEQQPYDLNVLSQLLDDYFPEKDFTVIKKPLVQTLPLVSTEKSSYIFTGARLYFSDTDRVHLRDFVYNGNDAFIITEVIPDNLLTNIFQGTSYSGYEFSSFADSSVQLNFFHPDLKKESGYTYDYIYEWKKELYSWSYFSDSLQKGGDFHFVALGSIEDSFVNFIKVPYGKGAFYLNSTPLSFTNYYLKQRDGLDYAEKVFSHLSPSAIYWDEFSKVPQMNNRRSDHEAETPLRYILSQPSLRWAWYVLLGMVALFLLFRAKRDQRIIPVVEQNANTSLEFIQTIGRLYFLQHDHRALAMQKMKLFLVFIRNRYGLQTKNMDTVFVQKLAEKSQVNFKSIEQLLENYQTIENMNDISVGQLSGFHAELETFYRSCK
ncbi:MAG: hypothetical protein ABIO46_14870 [Chitinophagales bacterium]